MKYTRQILLDDLQLGMKISESVISSMPADFNEIIVPKDTIVTTKIINDLQRHQIDWIEIFTHEEPEKKTDEIPAAQHTHEAIIRYEGSEPEVNSLISDELREEAIKEIGEVFAAIKEPGKIINKTTAYQAMKGFENALSQMVEAVTSDITGLVHIHDLKSYDEYTYHHSLSVALLSVATGQVLGLSDSQLMRLGRCALLHDVGKQTIPLTITNKRGKLTDEEYRQMKAHPTNGAFTLKSKYIGDVELWNGIIFHHEKVDGSGYPRGLLGHEIPLFSKIISIADVYDAVTSYRSYRNPMPPANAFDLICSEVGKSFEIDIVKAFAKRLVLYPIGTALELSDGRRGIVIKAKKIMRPTIKIWETNEIVDLNHRTNLSLAIVRVINPFEMVQVGDGAN